METMTHSARLLWIAATIGAVLGVALPFVVGGASLPFFTDIEARIGFGLLAALVYAMFGAAAGWTVGSIILHMRERRGPAGS